jgi:protein-S-isoprenylcysteine O-methyltransferase Ste14
LNPSAPDPVVHAAETAVRSSRRQHLVSAIARASNVLLAAYLGYGAYSRAISSDVWLPVRLIEGLATGLLAVLVLFRSAPVAARWNALTLIAVVISNGHGFAFDDQPETSGASEFVARVIMAAAGLWGSASRIYLGRSFAILPAVREIRTRGPYSIVRHPIYLSLIAYDVATVAAHPSPWNGCVAAVGITAHLARISIEERLLRREPAYLAYSMATRRRLIPFLW